MTTEDKRPVELHNIAPFWICPVASSFKGLMDSSETLWIEDHR